jgi:hypothetical protein
MPFNGRFIHRVHLSYTRCATGPLDLRRHQFERRQPAAGKKDMGAFAGEGLGNGTPDGAALVSSSPVIARVSYLEHGI